MKFHFSFFLIFVFFIQCQTYHKELKVYPEDLRSIYIENFSNFTFEPYVHQEFYDILLQKLHRRNTLKVVKNYNEASYFLKGMVTLFRREVLLYRDDFTPSYYKIDVVVEIRISNRQSQIQQYEIYETLRYSTYDPMRDNDFLTRNRIYERLSHKILQTTEQVILSDLKGKIP
ncbi:MAG: LPS assembly lipoprotein LptE [Leptospiraceae bacterium]|nr:LPS assembly lipoprotein LptE [Leptospiraceae bacterium]MDW7976838.1 LPS assembly lipoprotein LptE [Leptospiraceae bacterium]